MKSVLGVFILFFGLQTAWAALPPRLDRSVPEENGTMSADNTVIFGGMTMRAIGIEKVIDVENGRTVPFQYRYSCREPFNIWNWLPEATWTRDPHMVGPSRETCMMSVKILSTTAKHRYRIMFTGVHRDPNTREYSASVTRTDKEPEGFIETPEDHRDLAEIAHAVKFNFGKFAFTGFVLFILHYVVNTIIIIFLFTSNTWRRLINLNSQWKLLSLSLLGVLWLYAGTSLGEHQVDYWQRNWILFAAWMGTFIWLMTGLSFYFIYSKDIHPDLKSRVKKSIAYGLLSNPCWLLLLTH